MDWELLYTNILSFLRTLTIKNKFIIDEMNKNLRSQGYDVSDDPRTWKFYINTIGDYHRSDLIKPDINSFNIRRNTLIRNNENLDDIYFLTDLDNEDLRYYFNLDDYSPPRLDSNSRTLLNSRISINTYQKYLENNLLNGPIIIENRLPFIHDRLDQETIERYHVGTLNYRQLSSRYNENLIKSILYPRNVQYDQRTKRHQTVRREFIKADQNLRLPTRSPIYKDSFKITDLKTNRILIENTDYTVEKYLSPIISNNDTHQDDKLKEINRYNSFLHFGENVRAFKRGGDFIEYMTFRKQFENTNLIIEYETLYNELYDSMFSAPNFSLLAYSTHVLNDREAITIIDDVSQFLCFVEEYYYKDWLPTIDNKYEHIFYSSIWYLLYMGVLASKIKLIRTRATDPIFILESLRECKLENALDVFSSTKLADFYRDSIFIKKNRGSHEVYRILIEFLKNNTERPNTPNVPNNPNNPNNPNVPDTFNFRRIIINDIINIITPTSNIFNFLVIKTTDNWEIVTPKTQDKLLRDNFVNYILDILHTYIYRCTADFDVIITINNVSQNFTLMECLFLLDYCSKRHLGLNVLEENVKTRYHLENGFINLEYDIANLKEEERELINVDLYNRLRVNILDFNKRIKTKEDFRFHILHLFSIMESLYKEIIKTNDKKRRDFVNGIFNKSKDNVKFFDVVGDGIDRNRGYVDAPHDVRESKITYETFLTNKNMLSVINDYIETPLNNPSLNTDQRRNIRNRYDEIINHVLGQVIGIDNISYNVYYEDDDPSDYPKMKNLFDNLLSHRANTIYKEIPNGFNTSNDYFVKPKTDIENKDITIDILVRIEGQYMELIQSTIEED